MPANAGAASTNSGDPRSSPRLLAGIVVGIPAVIALMLLAFAAPALNSGARDAPLAVSGPAPAVERVVGMLDTAQPGAFEVKEFDTTDEAAEAIRRRDAVGGLALGPHGITVQLASGAGAPYATILRGIGSQLEATGQQVTYEDLAPLPAEDPSGTGLTTLALPLIFGGMASAAALVLAYRGGVWPRVGAALLAALLGGLIATAVLQFGFGVLEGSYALTALTVAAGIASISLVVLGLGMLIGPPGIGLGAVLMLFISNPISGLVAGWWFLPQPWGLIGQFLPLGASATALRSAAYFDGAGSGRAWVIMACWMLVGIALAYLGSRRTRRSD